MIDNAYASIESDKNEQYRDYILRLTNILGADDVDVASDYIIVRNQELKVRNGLRFNK